MAVIRESRRRSNWPATFTWMTGIISSLPSARPRTRVWGLRCNWGPSGFWGTLLPNPTAVPASVVMSLAAQLESRDTACLRQYHSRDTQWDHATQIRQVYG
jgi:hypothetical protein